MLHTTRDISERCWSIAEHAAEKALQESHHDFELYFKTLEDVYAQSVLEFWPADWRK